MVQKPDPVQRLYQDVWVYHPEGAEAVWPSDFLLAGQSFPSLKTVETFSEPEDRNIFSYVMEKHQRNNSANGRIMHYMEQTYLYPNDFDMTLYASQLL